MGRQLLGDVVIRSIKTEDGADIAAVAPGIVISLDGGGAPPATGVIGDAYIPVAVTIGTPWVLLADAAGNISLDLWVDVYANYPPTVADSIVAAAPPALAGANKGTGSTATWTRNLSAGSTLRVNLASIATITRFFFYVPISVG